MRRRYLGEKKLFTKRFYPGGTYTWVVPEGCEEVDVFLVGAGGGCSHNSSYGTPSGGGGGYTKTFRGHNYHSPSSGTWVGTYDEGRDGNAISVTPGQQIQIIVGSGVSGSNGGYSQFMNSNYRAEGGHLSQWNGDSLGGSGGVGTDRSTNSIGGSNGGGSGKIFGQGHTTRDFGEPEGKRNAGGGASSYNRSGGETSQPGASDYTEGSGEGSNESSSLASGWSAGLGGGGYGGGAGGNASGKSTKGGDGTVLIRYYAYEE